jgi:hypothetical protein
MEIHSRAGGVAQVVARLPSYCQALSSNLSAAKIKKNTFYYSIILNTTSVEGKQWV